MTDQVTKAKLLDELRLARREWDALLAEIGEERMTETGAAGDWSVKDVAAHLTSYSQRFISASEAHFRGELPPLDGTEGMDFETLNQHYYERNR
ncbi:MAG TPA: maleylpyruvate isomerase N-terminal domain-containing protein, partial [Anaerolineales bacterium]|nr:maleylpyruvate isomerase N-terminal domain-containing protein [Anaerolineales bacterium]